MLEQEEDALLARVRAGDEEAARLFFLAYHPAVARIVRNHPSTRHSEEDLCQMTFAKIFSRLDQYSGRMPVAHWISRVAVNTCLDELKKDRHRREIRETDLGEEAEALLQRVADPATETAEAARIAREVAQRLLDHLAPADRIVISLLYIDQCTVAETSALTGFTQAGVKVRAFRARRKLNKLVPHFAAKIL